MNQTKQIIEKRLNNDLLYDNDENILFCREFLLVQYEEGYVDEVRKTYLMLPPKIQDNIREIERTIYKDEDGEWNRKALEIVTKDK